MASNPKNRRRLIRALKRRGCGDYCCWCGRPFSKEEPPTIEHLTPRHHGGSNTLDNLELAPSAGGSTAPAWPVPRHADKTTVRDRPNRHPLILRLVWHLAL